MSWALGTPGVTCDAVCAVQAAAAGVASIGCRADITRSVNSANIASLMASLNVTCTELSEWNSPVGPAYLPWEGLPGSLVASDANVSGTMCTYGWGPKDDSTMQGLQPWSCGAADFTVRRDAPPPRTQHPIAGMARAAVPRHPHAAALPRTPTRSISPLVPRSPRGSAIATCLRPTRRPRRPRRRRLPRRYLRARCRRGSATPCQIRALRASRMPTVPLIRSGTSAIANTGRHLATVQSTARRASRS